MSHAKFQAAIKEMNLSLIERDEEIQLCMTGLLAGENLLLVGPPGCAKSLLLDSLLGWMGGKKFACLLNKFSTPEEVFGPVSVMGLKADEYRRVTTGMLPEADVAFLDEAFKASTAILNTLLKVLNEKTFTNGRDVVKCPLKLCVAASNEWPSTESGKELSALFDRFLLRKTVHPVRTRKGLDRLLFEASHSPTFSNNLDPAELVTAQREARALDLTENAKDALKDILKELGKEGIIPGDRRKFKAVGIARASAWLAGAAKVEPEHLEVLSHVLWDDPHEQPQKAAQIIMKVANPTGAQVTQLLLEAEEVAAGVNTKDIISLTTAGQKLKEIQGKVTALSGPSVAPALAHIADLGKSFRKAYLEAMG